MKKNVLKVLLMLVIVGLVFALVACGGDKKSNNNKNNNNNNKNNTDNTDTGDDKAAKVAALKSAITDIINNVGPLLKTVTSIQETSTVGVDLGLDGYAKGKNDSGNYQHTASLSLAAKANKTDPQAKLAVTYDEIDYFGLAYKAGKASLTEGLNMINSAAKNSKTVKMDVAYIEDGIVNAAAQGMKFLAGAVDNKTLKELDLAEIVLPLLSGKDKDGKPAGMKTDLYPTLADILTPTVTDSQAVLELTKDKVYAEDATKRKNTVVGILEGLSSAGMFDFASIEDTITEYVQQYGAKIIPALEGQTFVSLLTNYEPSLKIVAGYKGSGENKALNKISVAIVLNKTVSLEIGLNINLNMFSLSDTPDINVGGNAANLQSALDLNLGVKDLAGKLTATLNTATALANETNPIAVATFDLKKGDESIPPIVGSYDGSYIKVSADSFISDTNVVDSSAQATKFYQDLRVTQGNEKVNVKTVLKNWLEGLTYTKSEATEQPADTTDEDEGESVSLMTSIYNIVAGMFDVPEWNKKDNKGEPVDPTVDEIAAIALVGVYPYVKYYIAFDIADVDAKGNVTARSLTAIWNDIKEIFDPKDAKASDLTPKKIIKGAVYAEGAEAGVYVYGNEGKNLIAFVGAFVKIPALVEPKTENDGWTIDLTKDDNGMIVNTVGGEEWDADFIKHYIEALFALDDEEAAVNYAEWDKDIMEVFGIDLDTGFNASIIQTVFGISYTSIVDEGLVAYAGYDANKGLSGQVGLKSDDKELLYVELGASIGWVTGELTNVVFDNADAATFAVKDEQTQNYSMNEAVWNVILGTARYCFGE